MNSWCSWGNRYAVIYKRMERCGNWLQSFEFLCGYFNYVNG